MQILGFTYFRISVKIISWMTVAAYHTAGYLVDAIFESAMITTFWKDSLSNKLIMLLNHVKCVKKTYQIIYLLIVFSLLSGVVGLLNIFSPISALMDTGTKGVNNSSSLYLSHISLA